MLLSGVVNLFTTFKLYTCKQVYKSNNRATSYWSAKLICNTYFMLANKFTSPLVGLLPYWSGKLVCNTCAILANKFASPVRVSVRRSY